jgi:foldase protein PrsA
MECVRKQKKRIGKIVAAAVSMMVCLSGCQIGNHDIVVSHNMSSRQVFKIAGAACSLKEAMVYLANYQNIYGTCYGVELWEHDFGDDSLADYVKDVTLEELTQVYCMDLLAEEKGVALTESEIDSIAETAEEYYNSLSTEEIAYIGVSESDIAEYYSHYALARKIYHSLTDGVNAEVSDDEARVMEIMQIFVSNQERALQVKEKLQNGEDFASVANNYNELSSIQTTIARDELPAEVEEVVFQLDNDEISGMISTESGYYFVKCLNKYNEELTEANKFNIVEKREKEAFDDVYNEYISTLSSNLNEEVWNTLELEIDGTITTDTFFSVYEKYCSGI